MWDSLPSSSCHPRYSWSLGQGPKTMMSHTVASSDRQIDQPPAQTHPGLRGIGEGSGGGGAFPIKASPMPRSLTQFPTGSLSAAMTGDFLATKDTVASPGCGELPPTHTTAQVWVGQDRSENKVVFPSPPMIFSEGARDDLDKVDGIHSPALPLPSPALPLPASLGTTRPRGRRSSHLPFIHQLLKTRAATPGLGSCLW